MHSAPLPALQSCFENVKSAYSHARTHANTHAHAHIYLFGDRAVCYQQTLKLLDRVIFYSKFSREAKTMGSPDGEVIVDQKRVTLILHETNIYP